MAKTPNKNQTGKRAKRELPYRLDCLVSAAITGELARSLPREPDIECFVLAQACIYLLEDSEQALGNLWHAYRIWQPRDMASLELN